MPTIRPATVEDGPFLQAMLAIAADWRPGARVRSATEVMAEPGLAHYIQNWPLPGDVGFVAEDDELVGAAWWRHFPSHDPGYGFVDEAIPEVAIGVVAEARGRGVGTSLLRALVDEARRRRLPALSLSVEPDNPAVDLYRRVGFVSAGASHSSLTMILTVPRV